MGVDLDETGTSDLMFLYLAVLSGHKDVVELLFEAGADVDAMSDYFGTPLCLAALKGMDGGAVNTLLRTGQKLTP
jgi:ankyrin repeat protein